MKNLMWLLQWILKAAIFFTLFAFALNNQDDAVVHFFFGTQWRAPLVLVVLAAFTCGVAVGVLGMVPRWWRQKQAANSAQASQTVQTPNKSDNQQSSSTPPSEVSHGA